MKKDSSALTVTATGFPHLHHPELYSRLERKMMDYQNSRRFRNVSRILALSETIRKDLMEHYKVPADIIEVDYPSISHCHPRQDGDQNSTDIRKRLQLPERYLFISITAEKGNNLDLAVDALADISPDISLVIASRGAIPHLHALKKTAVRRGVLSRMIPLENIEEETIFALSAKAEIILCLSHGEGFPFSLLGAITTGRPVIAAGGLPNEEIGGDDVYYIDACDRTELIQAIHGILSDPASARMMGQAILTHAKKFIISPNS